MAEILPLPPRPRIRPSSEPEPLWRDLLGEQLRHLRHQRGETLTETADRAGLSPQYLSEIERGLKEPSSEMIAAVAGALGVTLIDLTTAVADELRGDSGRSFTAHTGTALSALNRGSLALAA
jgi:transcriptional regulator with XRE-family HTH domain